MLPLQGAWVQSLVGEVRSHMPRGVAKKKRRITHLDPVGLEEPFDFIKKTEGFVEYLNQWWDKGCPELVLLRSSGLSQSTRTLGPQ